MTEFQVKLNNKLSIPSEFETINVYEKKWIYLIYFLGIFLMLYYLIKGNNYFFTLIVIFIFLKGLELKKIIRTFMNYPYLVIFKKGVVYNGNNYYWNKITNEIEYYFDTEVDSNQKKYFITFNYETLNIKIELENYSTIKNEQTIQNIFCFKNKIYRENISL